MGRYFSAILCGLLLFTVSTVNASITSWTCADDGDGAIVMGTATLTATSDGYDLTMSGTQYWYPANVVGDFKTDTEEDPTVRIIEDVENDTTFAWTGYQITIGMSHTFSFVSAGLLIPDGWTVDIGVVSAGTMPNGDAGYVGTITYSKGTGDAIAVSDDGIFDFKVSFLGSTSFCTAQTPIPEPATIILLGLGAVAAIRRKKA